MTVFTLPQNVKLRVTADWVRVSVEKYETDDNVFDKAFLVTVIFYGAKKDDVELTDESREYLGKLGNEQVLFVSSPELLPGPYVLVGHELRDVWKIVDDSSGNRMATLKPQ